MITPDRDKLRGLLDQAVNRIVSIYETLPHLSETGRFTGLCAECPFDKLCNHNTEAEQQLILLQWPKRTYNPKNFRTTLPI